MPTNCGSRSSGPTGRWRPRRRSGWSGTAATCTSGSVNGRTAAWFRGAQASHRGHVEAGGVSKDVTFADPGDGVDDELDAAYRAKYRRYAPGVVNSVLTPQARSATVKLVPR